MPSYTAPASDGYVFRIKRKPPARSETAKAIQKFYDSIDKIEITKERVKIIMRDANSEKVAMAIRDGLEEMTAKRKREYEEYPAHFDAHQAVDDTVKWIRDWFAKNGPDSKAVIGISGGKDSSVAAALCVRALGADRVIGVLLPNGVQSDIDMAHLLCDTLGIKRYIININNTVTALRNSATEAGVAPISEQATINLPPRIRMSAIRLVAQCCNGRMINTCNLSEDWVGYSTVDGDAAGDVAPLALYTKTEVVLMGRALWLPTTLTEKVPSDGLCGKTDEDNLGFSYDVEDRYIRTGYCPNLAAKELIDKKHKWNLFKMRKADRCDVYMPDPWDKEFKGYRA